MAKIFDNPEVQERRLNEDSWFFINQPILLSLVNSDYGRDLLCIPKEYPKIISIGKSHVTCKLDSKYKLSDFRIGTKYGNGIRQRWNEYKAFEKWYWNRYNPTDLLPFKYKSEALLVATTTTVYPDPDPETSTVDGIVVREAVSESFATIRGGAGVTAVDTDVVSECMLLQADEITDKYVALYRGIFLFDASSITDTDVISATVMSLFGSTKTNTLSLSSANAGCAIVASTPASNTALAASDYGNLGSTRFATDIAYDSLSTVAYNDFTFNATGIAAVSKTGISKFGTRMAIDLDNGSPTWTDSNQTDFGVIFADTALTTTDPKLVVTHAAPPPTTGGTGTMMGI